MAGQNSTTKHVAVVIALTLAVLLAALDGTIVATALPSIVDELGSAKGYGWVGSAYLLAVTALLPLWGNLSDVWGRKMAILLANSVFFVGSLICALAVNMGMLIAGRTIQGAGAAGLVLLVNIILSDLFAIKERAKFMGITNTSWAVAAAIGPLIGGAFAQNATWRWCFYLNLPLTGVVFALLLIFLRIDQQRASFLASIKAIDWIGVVLIIGGTLMLLLGLQFGATSRPWDSAAVICLIVFGVLVMAGFVFAEWYVTKYTTQRPIVPIELFKNRSPLAVLVCFWIHGIIGVAPYYYLPLFFQVVRSATPILSGVYILPMVLTAAITTMATGIFAQVTGYIVEPIWAGFLLTTAGLGLFINLDQHSSWAKLIIYQLLFGLGLGPNYSAPLLAVQRVVEARDIAIATSTVAFSRQLGSSLSLVIGDSIIQSQLRGTRPRLLAGLGPDDAAHLLSSNTEVPGRAFMQSLSPSQRDLVRDVYASSIRPMYYVYVALSGVAFLVGFLIARGKLQDPPSSDTLSDTLSLGESPDATTVEKGEQTQVSDKIG